MNRTSSEPTRGAAAVLGERAEVGLVGDRDRDGQCRAPRRSALAERDVVPAEVGGHRDEPVAPADDADDGDADADQRFAGGPAGAELGREARRGRRRSRRPRSGRAAGRPGSVRGPRRPARRPPRRASRRRCRGPGRRRRPGSGATSGEGRPGVPVGAARSSDTSPPRPARRSGSRIALRVRPVRATRSERDRRTADVQLAHDRAQVRPADRLAALAESRRGASSTDLCSSLPNVVTDWSRRPAVSRRLGRWADDELRCRWGILSTADIARKKVIPGLQKARRCEVVAIASRDGARARRSPTSSASRRSHGSYEALLADPDVDAVYIPLPNHLHAEWTIAAARAGKHVLCEKPLALTAADAETMVEACARRGRPADGGVHVSAPSRRGSRSREVVASGASAGCVRSRAGSRTSTTTRRTSATRSTRAAARCATSAATAVNLSRMLFDGEPAGVRAAIVRDPRPESDVLTSAILGFDDGHGHVHRARPGVETDQRVHVYGATGRLSIAHPVQHPARPARRGVHRPPAAIRRSRRRPRC